MSLDAIFQPRRAIIWLVLLAGVLVLVGCFSTKLSDRAATKRLWYERGFVKEVLSLPSDEIVYDIDEFADAIEAQSEGRDIKIEVHRRAVLRVELGVKGRAVDGWLEMRDQPNGSTQIVWNGIEAGEQGLDNGKISIGRARPIYKRSLEEIILLAPEAHASLTLSRSDSD